MGKKYLSIPNEETPYIIVSMEQSQEIERRSSHGTIFMSTPGYDRSTCAQVFVRLMSRMINVYPMPSKAHGYVLKAYQDFMRYEGVPKGLHQDQAPEEKVQKIID